MKSLLTLFAYFIVLTCTLASKQSSTNTRGSRTSTGTRVIPDTIDIDAAHDDGDLALAGSGAGPDDDTEMGEDDVVDEEISGDGIDGDVESGDGGDIIPTPSPVLTLCQERRRRLMSGSSRPLLGAFTPRCADDGSYELRQCHASTGECWCVDAAEGKEITGTRRRAPQIPDCVATTVIRQSTAPITAQPTTTTTSELRRPAVTSRPDRTRPSTSTRASTMQSSTTSPPAVSTSFGRAATSSVDIINKIDQIPNEPEIKFDGPPADTESNYIERPVAVSEPKSRRMSLRASVIGQPGILAAIIGAAVVVLLCLVLLVMFIVYRMHRKSQDPAIYYIDKSSRTPLAGAAATNGPSVGFGSNRKPGGYMKAMDADVYG